MHIRIINPTITRGWEEDSLMAYAKAAQAGTQLSLVSLDWGTASIESYRDHALVIPDILNKVVAAEQEGVEAVIIDCMGDPGLYPARELVRIPVVGPAEASLHLAAMLGHRFTVLTVLESRIPMMEEQVARYGLSGKLASVRAFNIPVLELEKDPDKTVSTIVELSECAIRQDGAHVIVPACTGLAGLFSRIQAELSRRGYDAPVLDPPAIAMKTAEMLVSLGLSHSKSTFARPNPKPYQWPGKILYGE